MTGAANRSGRSRRPHRGEPERRRGRPLIRGSVCGLMTALGGLGHTLPYLLPDRYWHLATGIAIAVVGLELGLISWIRHRFMDTPLAAAVFQVVIGGLLVFITGILIGNS